MVDFGTERPGSQVWLPQLWLSRCTNAIKQEFETLTRAPPYGFDEVLRNFGTWRHYFNPHFNMSAASAVTVLITLPAHLPESATNTTIQSSPTLLAYAVDGLLPTFH